MASQYYSHASYSTPWFPRYQFDSVPETQITSMSSLLFSTRMRDMSPDLQNTFNAFDKQIRSQREAMEKIETVNESSFSQDYEKLLQDMKDTVQTMKQDEEKIVEVIQATQKLNSTVDVVYTKKGNLHNSEFAHKYFSELLASIKQKSEAYIKVIHSLYEDCENSSPAQPSLPAVLRVIDSQMTSLMRLADIVSRIHDQLEQRQIVQKHLTPKKPRPTSPSFTFTSPFAREYTSPFATPIATQATPPPTSSAYPFATPPPSPYTFAAAPSVLSFTTPATQPSANSFNSFSAPFSSPISTTLAPPSFGVPPNPQPQPSSAFGSSLFGTPTSTANPTQTTPPTPFTPTSPYAATPNALNNYTQPSTPVSPIPISFGSPATAPSSAFQFASDVTSTSGFGSPAPASQKQMFNSPISYASASQSSPLTFGNLFSNTNQTSASTASSSSSRNNGNNNNNTNTNNTNRETHRNRRNSSNRNK